MGLILDLKNQLTVSQALPPAAVTASGNGTGVDCKGVLGSVMAVFHSAAGTGTTPTLAIKVQGSPDNSTFTDISGATFTTVTDAGGTAGVQTLNVEIRATDRYLRMVKTAGGTSPSFVCSGEFIYQKQLV
jgi:hypothetical protein